MRKTYLRQKQNAAKFELLTIGEQDTSYDRRWLNSPAAQPIKSQAATRQRLKKTKTEVSSPSSRMREDSKQALKTHLLQLKKQSEIEAKQSSRQLVEAKSYPLKPRLFNNQSIKTVQDLYISKQRSEERMRPLIYIQDFKKQYEEQQQKLRIIIKRKLMAKDLFRKCKLGPEKTQRQQSLLFRNLSQKQSMKRNLIFIKHKNLLPHIH